MKKQSIQLVPLKSIIAGKNDRTTFDPVKLADLAASIQEHGLQNPVTLRTRLDGKYEIVAGERRVRAYQINKAVVIPAIVQDLTDEQAAAIMLAENVSRADLDPIDEASAYKRRIDDFGWTVPDVARKAGVSTVRVQQRLRLLDLRLDLQDLVRSSNLELGYAVIISQAGLDLNFQTLAFKALRDNPSPTPSWFRRICGELKNKQDQVRLFDDPLFTGRPIEMEVTKVTEDPPHPLNTTPPAVGKTPVEIIGNQAIFWDQAAIAWEQKGKPFRRQECQAAAQAVRYALASLTQS